MDDLARWQRGNDEYLSGALAWLRLRLAHLAPPGPTGVTAEQMTQAAAALRAAEAMTPPPALVMLSQRFHLSRFEQEILLLCAAMELDTRIAALCARAQDDPNRPYPTFALALALFDEPSWDALSPEGALRHWRLIEINQPGAQPLTTSALRADERIVNYLKGLNYLDDRLMPLFMPLDVDALSAILPPSQQRVAQTIVRQLRQTAAAQRPPVVQLLGADGLSKQLIAWQVATALGLRLYRLPTDLLPAQAAELETLARLLEREMALWSFALYLDAHDVDNETPGEEHALPLNRFIARSQGVCFLDTRDVRSGLGRAIIEFDIGKPTRAEQQAAWSALLGDADDGIAARLAGQFDLNLPAIQQTAHSTLANSNGHTPMALRDRLWGACLGSTRPRLDVLAQRIEPKATWEDIVMPEAELSLLRQIAAQVGQRNKVYEEWGFAAKRTRGLGINALFAGESGTGKTMAAEVIANELRLNLYRIDLSAVVSKYIGETEKNLRRLFDAAEDGGALLFFDEADALFGKRSEVKDGLDRYANIEVNYLLQRMESYRGLAILATNMRSALDTAFVRRLRFIVEFRAHGPAERRAIWERIFPPETCTQGLDFERLARLALNGGSINNIAINAAFLAAQAGAPVTMPLVLQAARAEYQKLKRPINSDDFYWREPAEVAA